MATHLEALERACAEAASAVTHAEERAARARSAAVRRDEQLAGAAGLREAAASSLADAEAALRALDLDAARRVARDRFEAVGGDAATAEAIRAAGDRWIGEARTIASAAADAAAALEVAAIAAEAAAAVESRAASEAAAARNRLAAADDALHVARAALAAAGAAREAEVERLAEAARRAEAARLAEERRRAEQARLAEQARVAEAARLVAEEALAEATRRAEAARAAAEEAAAAVNALDRADTAPGQADGASSQADTAPAQADSDPGAAPADPIAGGRLAALEALLGPAPAALATAAHVPSAAPSAGAEAPMSPVEPPRGKGRGRAGAATAAAPSPRPEPSAASDPAPEADIRAVTMPADATVRRVLGGDLAALERVGAASGGARADQARRTARLTELMETLLVRALDANALALPMEHPFWGLFSGQQARDVMAALAVLGHRFDGLGGWEDGRVPGQRELSIAIAHAGLDPMRVRRYPARPEAETLLRDAHVLGGDWLAAVAPRLTVRELRLVLGREADAFADLWAEWDAIRPLLLAPA